MLIMLAILILLASWIVYVIAIRIRRSLKVDNFAEKYVFITGCDTGFGRELAIHLDSLGFHVFAGCLTEQGAQSLLNITSNRLSTTVLDVSKSESIETALEFVKQRLPAEKGLWALVNNAGILGGVRPVELCDKEDYIKVLNVNLLGPVEMTRQFLPLVRKSRGRIVIITSSYGRFAAIGAPYCASKFGLEAYSDILRRDVWSQGLKVSIIEPGGFLTSLLCVDNLRKDMNQCLERATPDMRNLYQSSLAPWVLAMGGSTFISSSLRPVVDAYTHAITARFPCNRYVVGLDAQLVYIPLSYLPDWFCDWLLRMLAKLAKIK